MSLKKSFSKDKQTCTVTFTVSKEAAQGAKTINLAGDFNSWSSTDTPLTLGNDGSFSVTLELAADREYQFRFTGSVDVTCEIRATSLHDLGEDL